MTDSFALAASLTCSASSPVVMPACATTTAHDLPPASFTTSPARASAFRPSFIRATRPTLPANCSTCWRLVISACTAPPASRVMAWVPGWPGLRWLQRWVATANSPRRSPRWPRKLISAIWRWSRCICGRSVRASPMESSSFASGGVHDGPHASTSSRRGRRGLSARPTGRWCIRRLAGGKAFYAVPAAVLSVRGSGQDPQRARDGWKRQNLPTDPAPRWVHPPHALAFGQ